MNSLCQLPASVVSSLISFLPQESLLALASTNFQFYDPCLRKLYQNLVIQVDPILKNDLGQGSKKRPDHIALSGTYITGFQNLFVNKNPTLNRRVHYRLVCARLRTLIQAIQVNPQLAKYIESIEVLNNVEPEVCMVVRHLLDTLAGLPNGVRRVYIENEKVRKEVGYTEFIEKFDLELVMLSEFVEIANLHSLSPRCHEVIVLNAKTRKPLPESAVSTLSEIKSLRFSNHDAFVNSMHMLWDLYKASPFLMAKLTSINLVASPEIARGLPFLDLSRIQNLEVSVGCTEFEQSLFADLEEIVWPRLKRLAIVQTSAPQESYHKYTEAWDLAAFHFVQHVVRLSPLLFYLSIRHDVPADGNIDDGFEGNYMRKVKLYTNLLPNLLASIDRHVVNLVLPTLISSLACYEQPMNTFLWNGCKCSHCEVHLGRLDDYLLHHRYYSYARDVFKDLTTVQLMRSMGEVLSDRAPYDENVGDLWLLGRPLRNVAWNFHDSKFSVPFLCLPVKNYEMDVFEDDRRERKHDKFFDAESEPNDCRFLHRERFVPDYALVVVHYLDDLIRRMINLNRGNAEDVHIGQTQDENDGYTNLRINKMVVNGIDYVFDHEINGTIFFVHSHD